MKRILNLIIAISLILILCVSCGTKDMNDPSTIVDSNTGNNDKNTSSNNDDLGDDTSVDNNGNNNNDSGNNTNANSDKGDVNPDNSQNEETYSFTAKILETEGGLLIAPDEGTNETRSSDKISVHTNTSKFYDKFGNEISLDQLEVGDHIEIVYNGMIMESYPAQIGAISITLTEDKELLQAYKAVIDDVYQDDSALNSDISIIALDLEDVNNLTEEELVTLVEMVDETYGSAGIEVMKATYKELIEQGLVDDENLYFEKGILITIKEPQYDRKKMTLTYGIEKWRSGLGAIGSDKATAKFKDGEWKITKEDMWIS